MSQGFRWHPDARLLGPDGPLAPPGPLAAAMAGPGPMFHTLTGGSTGHPRRIRRSQASWIASFAVTERLFAPRRIATLGALQHSLALYAAVEGLHLGAEVHLLDALRPDRQHRALAKRRVDLLYATPAQLRLLPAAALPDLRVILCGGARLDAGLRARLAALAPGAKLHEFYGAAETSFIALSDDDTPEGAVGRPYPGVQIDIRAGAVWVRSPYLFDGYDGDPGGAERDGDWLTVGEMGRLQEGFLWLDGRRDRMVRVAEHTVHPEAVEAFLLALPGVARAAVLARPDALRGAVLVAVLQGDAADGDVQAALQAHLGSTLAPKRRVWRRDWPVLPSGKTDLGALERDT